MGKHEGLSPSDKCPLNHRHTSSAPPGPVTAPLGQTFHGAPRSYKTWKEEVTCFVPVLGPQALCEWTDCELSSGGHSELTVNSLEVQTVSRPLKRPVDWRVSSGWDGEGLNLKPSRAQGSPRPLPPVQIHSVWTSRVRRGKPQLCKSPTGFFPQPVVNPTQPVPSAPSPLCLSV